jgi:hypothetical protein
MPASPEEEPSRPATLPSPLPSSTLLTTRRRHCQLAAAAGSRHPSSQWRTASTAPANPIAMMMPSRSISPEPSRQIALTGAKCPSGIGEVIIIPRSEAPCKRRQSMSAKGQTEKGRHHRKTRPVNPPQRKRSLAVGTAGLCQGRRSCAAVRGSALPQKADQPPLQSIIFSVQIADIGRTSPNHHGGTLAIIELG